MKPALHRALSLGGLVLVGVACGGTDANEPATQGADLSAAPSAGTPDDQMRNAFLATPAYVAFAKKQSTQIGADCHKPTMKEVNFATEHRGDHVRGFTLYVATPSCGIDDFLAAVVQYSADVTSTAAPRLHVFSGINSVAQEAVATSLDGSTAATKTRDSLENVFRASSGFVDFKGKAPRNIETEVTAFTLRQVEGSGGGEEAVLFIADYDDLANKASYSAIVKREFTTDDPDDTVQIFDKDVDAAVRFAVDTEI